MILKHLSNDELHVQTKNLSDKERHTTLEILWHLRENEKRMLFAKMGYRDLKEYCVKELKYSEGSAWRRINAMKVLKDVPEIERKIESGELNLVQVSMAATHFREVKATVVEKKEVLASLENQSTRKTERILAENKPEFLTPKKIESEKPLRGNRVELTVVIDEELLNIYEEIEKHLGRKCSKLELLKMTAKETLDNLQKQKQAEKIRDEKREAQPAVNGKLKGTRSRYVSKYLLRKVKERDGHRCQYRGPISGKQCEAREHLQVEHVVPFAKGGSHAPENLQLLCVNHNRLRAVDEFGVEKMREFYSGLR